MENDVLDALEDLGYDGALLDTDLFNTAVDDGASSVEFTKLVAWLTKQLNEFCGLEECVNAIDNSDDATNFMMELGSCLRELNCPMKNLYEGQMSERLANKQSRLQLLDYLTSELSSVRMLAVKKPGLLKSAPTDSSKPKEMSESDVAMHLRFLLMTLGFSKPPTNISSFQLFNKVEAKVKELVSQKPDSIGKPLMKARLSDKQWAQVMKINDALIKEYSTRREMLLKRLDVTIQSFMWGDKAKTKQNEIAAIYQPIRKALMTKPQIGIPQILCTRDDLTRLQKTSSGEAREKTKCAINKVLIPKVPDRGGRAWELEPPPPEMPAFQKREAGGGRPQSGRGGYQGGGGGGYQGGGGGYQGGGGGYQGGGGGGYQGGGGRGGGGGYQGGGGRGGGGGYQGGGGRGGGRGGKVQGGWGDSQGQNQGGNWQQGGGGYGNTGGYQGFNQGGGGNSNQGGGNYQGDGANYNQGHNDNYRGGRGRRGSGRGGRGRGGY